MQKFNALLMAGMMLCSSVVPAFAATPGEPELPNYTHNQSAGSDSDMEIDLWVKGVTEPTIFSAYVPAKIKIAVDADSKVITPENLRIINGVEAKDIAVTGVKGNAVPGWELMPWSTDFAAAELADQKKFGLSLQGKDLTAPIDNLPWKITANSELPLDLDLKLTIQHQTADPEKIMSVTFTMDWADKAHGNKPYANGTVLSKAKMDTQISQLTGKITFSNKAYDGELSGISDISAAGDGSVICVVSGQDATIYGDGGVLAPNDCINLFANYPAKQMDLSGLDTRNVTSMYQMFHNTKAENLDLSSFDTSKVAYMNNMFNASKAKAINVKAFDTRKVTDMSNMFSNSVVEIIDLSSFDTQSLTDASSMFTSAKAKIVDLSSMELGYASVSTMFRAFNGGKVYCRNQNDLNKISGQGEGSSYATLVVGHPTSEELHPTQPEVIP